MRDDPKRAYFRLLHVLSTAIPNSAEKIIDEFQIPDDLPEVTRQLMLEAIKSSMKKLKAIEERLSKLERRVSEVEKR
jgi:hypothetical protein